MKRLCVAGLFLFSTTCWAANSAPAPATNHGGRGRITVIPIAQPEAAESSTETPAPISELFGRYLVRARMMIQNLANSTQISVERGTIFTVLNDSSSCPNEATPDLGETGRDYNDACPAWAELIRISNHSDAAVNGHCFCTARSNIQAQERVEFEEDGVTVTTPPPSETPPPVPYLNELYRIAKENACKKKAFFEKGSKPRARIARCEARGKSVCNCSALRCAQILKKTLADAGLIRSVSDLPGDANAQGIKDGLISNGFMKCSEIDSAAGAPFGSVIIYHAREKHPNSDPGSPYGHIELKTPSGYMSDFITPSPRTEYGYTVSKRVNGRNRQVNNRYVAGVYVKPPVKCSGN